jgi:hypothetical protein
MKRRLLSWGSVVLMSGLVAVGCGGSGSQTTGGGTGTGDTGGGGSTGDPDGGVVSSGGGAIVVTVNAASNAVTLAGCGFSPAQIAGVPAGTYTITLTASTLTKGGVSGPRPSAPSADNYVIVHVPLAGGDPDEKHRFFMLNGVGANASITLSGTTTIDGMFIDSDQASNSGTATVTLTPGNQSMVVSATTNDLAYDTLCHSKPATQAVAGSAFRVTLLDSGFSSGSGAHDDFVLVRTPSEEPNNDHRYVILNGDGASQDFSPFNSQTVRMWYIGASAGTGIAHVQIAPM